MTDEQKPDDTPEPEDPQLDAFTRLMETGSSLDDRDLVEEREVDIDKVDAIHARIWTFLNDEIQPEGAYYIEVQMALAAIFLDLSRAWLADCDYDTFGLNRAAVLRVVGIMSAHINEIKPDARELINADVSPVLQ